MKYFLITGTSTGLGKALAEALLAEADHRVIGIARSCSIQHPRYTHQTKDLSLPDNLSDFSFPEWEDATKIVLINNAATIDPIRPFGKQEAVAIARSYQLNLIAPAILTNRFISTFADVKAEKMVINVSSGAAQYPIDSWGHYCASKAGLDMLSRVADMEQKDGPGHPVRVVAIAPGIVDTPMQARIRETSGEDFKQVDRFIDYHQTGELMDPKQVAEKYLDFIRHPEKYPEAVLSVRTM